MNKQEAKEIGDAMIESKKPGLRGALYRRWKKYQAGREIRHAERRRKKDLYRKYKKQLEPNFIKKKVVLDLKRKYGKKKQQTGFTWTLPKQGQKSAGQNIFDALERMNNPKKKVKL